MRIASEKYFLQSIATKRWEEVKKDVYLQAEREAGFYPKVEGEPACAAFCKGSIKGRCDVKYDWND